jgi:hypothetical protein
LARVGVEVSDAGREDGPAGGLPAAAANRRPAARVRPGVRGGGIIADDDGAGAAAADVSAAAAATASLPPAALSRARRRLYGEAAEPRGLTVWWRVVTGVEGRRRRRREGVRTTCLA